MVKIMNNLILTRKNKIKIKMGYINGNINDPNDILLTVSIL